MKAERGKTKQSKIRVCNENFNYAPIRDILLEIQAGGKISVLKAWRSPNQPNPTVACKELFLATYHEQNEKNIGHLNAFEMVDINRFDMLIKAIPSISFHRLHSACGTFAASSDYVS